MAGLPEVGIKQLEFRSTYIIVIYHWIYILVYTLFFADLYYDMLIHVFIEHHPFNVIGQCDAFNIYLG